MSCKGGSDDGASGNARLTEFAMGMLDTSTGLLKSLPEKPALSRVSSEADNYSVQRKRSIVGESYGFGNGSFSYSSGAVGGGFAIGAPRDRDENGDVDLESSNGMRSGLASPSSSVSSSGESRAPYEGFNGRNGFGVDVRREAY